MMKEFLLYITIFLNYISLAGAQTSLALVDIVILSNETDTPDNFAFGTFVDIAAGSKIYFSNYDTDTTSFSKPRIEDEFRYNFPKRDICSLLGEENNNLFYNRTYDNCPTQDIKYNYMIKKSNKEICSSYLNKYAAKDLNGIQEMFAEDIVLRDWKIRVTGKKNAVEETRKNFESVDSIDIEILSTYENKNTVAAELKITIDGSEELYVVDVITINAESKIQSIRAYLGRGDN